MNPIKANGLEISERHVISYEQMGIYYLAYFRSYIENPFRILLHFAEGRGKADVVYTINTEPCN